MASKFVKQLKNIFNNQKISFLGDKGLIYWDIIYLIEKVIQDLFNGGKLYFIG